MKSRSSVQPRLHSRSMDCKHIGPRYALLYRHCAEPLFAKSAPSYKGRMGRWCCRRRIRPKSFSGGSGGICRGVGPHVEHRIRMAGIKDLPGLFALDSRQRAKSGAAYGAKRSGICCAGWNCQKRQTARRSVGHSHVLALELRDPTKARDVARRLTLKAASRLRRMEYYAGAMSFGPWLKMA